jgi:hypothetical protein
MRVPAYNQPVSEVMKGTSRNPSLDYVSEIDLVLGRPKEDFSSHLSLAIMVGTFCTATFSVEAALPLVTQLSLKL